MINFGAKLVILLMILTVNAMAHLTMAQKTIELKNMDQKTTPQTIRNYFIAITYHDNMESFDKFQDDSILARDLVNHFQWLTENGFTPVSMDDLIAAQKGHKRLPDKPVLLTFDDGYRSFYDEVFPLLKAFNYPAVLAIVSHWIDTPAGRIVKYGAAGVPRDRFMTWPQIKEVSDSGLVEIANHSYDHHRDVLANPQGSREPIMTTLAYDPITKTYETADSMRNRIKADLKRNSEIIFQHTGKRPRIMVWPYGRFNGISVQIAKSLGMPYNFLLSDDKKNDISDLTMISRNYYSENVELPGLISAVEKWETPWISPIRSIRVDMDAIYDKDPAIAERNLSNLIERVHRYQISTVFLSPLSKAPGEKKAYFLNRHLSLQGDLLNRVFWQLHVRGGVDVYAWIPISDLPLNRQQIMDFNEDLASHVPLDGIAFIGEENASNNGLVQELNQMIHHAHPEMKTARGLVVPPVMDDQSEKTFVKKLDSVTTQFDLAILMSPSSPEGSESTNSWIYDIVPVIKKNPERLRKTFIDLNISAVADTICRGNDDDSTPRLLVDQMRYLQENGVLNYGYSLDNFKTNRPDDLIVHEGLSMQSVLEILPIKPVQNDLKEKR